MQARYYDPVIGRFYSNDPVGYTGEVDTFNRYSYVANNPYKYTDPNGEEKYTLFAEIQAVAKFGFVAGGSISFDTETFEISITGKGGARAGLSGGAKAGLKVQESGQAKGNSITASASVNIDAGIGPVSQKIDLASGEFSTSDGFKNTSGDGTKTSGGLNLANGASVNLKAGVSAGVDSTVTGNLSIPDTLQNVQNAVKEIENFVCPSC